MNPLHFDEKTPLNLFTDDSYLTMNPIIKCSTNRFIMKTRDKVISENIRSILTSKNRVQIKIFGLVA